MSFPGSNVHRTPPAGASGAISLSFLVDTMDKRRGGCAPNIAYTLALLGERPMLMATAGQDFGDYRRWLEAPASTRRWSRRSRASSPRRSFAARTSRTIRSPRSIPARWPCRRAVVPHGQGLSPTIISPNDPGAMVQYGGVPRARHPLHLRSRPAVRAHVGRRAARRLVGAPILDLQRLRNRADSRQKTGLAETDILQACRAGHHARRERIDHSAEGTGESTFRPCRRASPIRRASGDAFRGGLMKGLAAGADGVCARLGSVAATDTLEHLGGQSHAYTRNGIPARYEQHFGALRSDHPTTDDRRPSPPAPPRSAAAHGSRSVAASRDRAARPPSRWRRRLPTRGELICHQRPERSFSPRGAPVACLRPVQRTVRGRGALVRCDRPLVASRTAELTRRSTAIGPVAGDGAARPPTVTAYSRGWRARRG